MGMNMLRAGVIAQRIDVSESQYPGVIAAALFIVSHSINACPFVSLQQHRSISVAFDLREGIPYVPVKNEAV
jgi:hypothetical protein